MRSSRRVGQVALVIGITAGALLAVAETRQEFHYIVTHNSSFSLNNPYGNISVKTASGNQITVTAILHSDQVEVDKDQHGNRIDVASRLLPGANANTGQVDYEITVPADASVNLHATSGQVHAEKLHGDVNVEAISSSVDVRDVSDAHVHVKTMNGPITLTNIKNGHVEVTSISGNVMLNAVTGRLIQVTSSSGKILYDGDFGAGGEYVLHSHSGDIEATTPAAASIEVLAESRGTVDSDFPLEARRSTSPHKVLGTAFIASMNKALSSVKLRSFSGKIHLKKR